MTSVLTHIYTFIHSLICSFFSKVPSIDQGHVSEKNRRKLPAMLELTYQNVATGNKCAPDIPWPDGAQGMWHWKREIKQETPIWVLGEVVLLTKTIKENKLVVGGETRPSMCEGVHVSDKGKGNVKNPKLILLAQISPKWDTTNGKGRWGRLLRWELPAGALLPHTPGKLREAAGVHRVLMAVAKQRCRCCFPHLAMNIKWTSIFFKS